MILSITSVQWSDIISDDDVGMIIRDHTYFIIHIHTEYIQVIQVIQVIRSCTQGIAIYIYIYSHLHGPHA